MAAGGLSEKTGDRLKRRESNRKLERTRRGASVCTRFFRKTDTAPFLEVSGSVITPPRLPVATTNFMASNRLDLDSAATKAQAAANRNLLQVRLLYLHDDIVIPTGEVKSFVSG